MTLGASKAGNLHRPHVSNGAGQAFVLPHSSHQRLGDTSLRFALSRNVWRPVRGAAREEFGPRQTPAQQASPLRRRNSTSTPRPSRSCFWSRAASASPRSRKRTRARASPTSSLPLPANRRRPIRSSRSHPARVRPTLPTKTVTRSATRSSCTEDEPRQIRMPSRPSPECRPRSHLAALMPVARLFPRRRSGHPGVAGEDPRYLMVATTSIMASTTFASNCVPRLTFNCSSAAVGDSGRRYGRLPIIALNESATETMRTASGMSEA